MNFVIAFNGSGLFHNNVKAYEYGIMEAFWCDRGICDIFCAICNLDKSGIKNSLDIIEICSGICIQMNSHSVQ